MKHIFTSFIATLLLLDASAQLNMTFLGKLVYSNDIASLWGYAANGKEYALVGAYGGLSIVDVTTPSAPNEVQFISTENSIWHEIKTWSHYAYVVNENGGGLLITDLQNLPTSVNSVNWTGSSLGLETGHTLWIDENGICYINGSNVDNGGVLFLDLNSDPMNPTYLGKYDDSYVHDCFVRGDTMITSEIYDGRFRVIDVSDKSNPQLLAEQHTPGNFNHNSSRSDNGKYLFTTDEVSNSSIASYDISDLSNITQLDLFQATPGSNSIGHNVHVKGNYLVIAYYRDGVIIADATHPDNIIKVGSYDTSPFSGSGYNGCWEAYAFLPSGNIIAADIEEGLFVLGATYNPACYLTGSVKDYSTGSSLNGVTVSITGSGTSVQTNLSGDYATGYATGGTYSVAFSKSGYWTKTISKVSLSNGITKVLNTSLKSTSLPQCVVPSGLIATEISNTSAKLNWSDEYALKYTIKLKDLSTNLTSTLTSTSNSVTASGLSTCTSYKFKVKAKCLNTGKFTTFSPWFSFSTPQICKESIGTLSVKDHSEFLAYPNPFNDQFRVSLTIDHAAPTTISIFDATGKLMKSQTFSAVTEGKNTFDIYAPGLPEGIYVCVVKTADSVFTQRILKSSQ